MPARPSPSDRPRLRRSGLLRAGSWSTETASARLDLRRTLGDRVSVSFADAQVVAVLAADPADGLTLRADLTAQPTRSHRKILGDDTGASLRLVRPIGCAPGVWRAPAMVTIGSVTELVRASVSFDLSTTTDLTPLLGVSITVVSDAATLGLARMRGGVGPATLTVRGALTSPSAADHDGASPWAYAA